MVELADDTFDHVVEVIDQNLVARQTTCLNRARAASVVVAVYDVGGKAHYCLIKRAKRGRNAGQWALPGGKVEMGETRRDAALREAEEEVELPRTAVRVVGQLDDIATWSGFTISAFVVAAPLGWRPAAASTEVQQAYQFSIAGLVADGVVNWARVDNARPLLHMHLGAGVRIHAPTGAILWQLRETGLYGRDVSVADVRHPEFTRH